MKELNICNMELFEINDSYYAFDVGRLYVWKVTESVYELLKYVEQHRKIDAARFNPRDIMQVMMKIKQGYFFSEKEQKCSEEMPKANQLIISFPIVHECNLRCRYCYAKSGEIYKGETRMISIPVINKIIEFIEKRFQNIRNIRLEFVSGGETLLNKDKFFEIVEYFKGNMESKGFSVHIFLLTNGTILDEDTLYKIDKLGASLGVSLDGTEDIQNYQRPLKSGEGTYERVCNTIKMIREYPSLKEKIWVVSVITAASPKLEEILNHHIEIGVNSMEMRVVRGDYPEELALNEINLEEFKEKYREFAEYLKKNPSKVKYIINEYDTFGKILRRILLHIGVYYRCTAGVYKFSFTADGDIYACDSFVGHENFKMGNVLDDDRKEEMFTQYSNLSVVKCKSCRECKYKFWCGGDCNYNAYCNTGAMNDKKSIFCELQIFLCKVSIDLIEYMKEHSKREYDFLVRYVKKQSKMLYSNDCLEDE